MPHAPILIHPTAIIDDGARIGQGTRIWHFSHVMPHAVIGANCNLGQNIFVDNNVIIGEGVKIQNNVSIYDGVEIRDMVFIGPSVVFTNVINPRSFINRKNEFKKTIIERGVTIGANATIICGVTVGEYAFIGAGAVVTKAVLPYALITGNPGRQTGFMSEHGATLRFDINNQAVCGISGERYRLIDQTVTRVH